MLDDGGGHDVGGLRARVVAHDETDEAGVFEDGDGEAVFAGLERDAEFEDEEGVFVDGVGSDLDGGDGRSGAHGVAVGFELENFHAVADGGGVVEAGTGNALEEFGGRRGEESEVGVIIDRFDPRGGFESGLGFFQLDVGVVGHEFGGDENTSVDQDDPEALTDGGGVFAPGLGEVPRLAGDVDAHHRRGLRIDGRRGGLRRGFRSGRGGGFSRRRLGFGGREVLPQGLHRADWRSGKQDEKNGEADRHQRFSSMAMP